MKNFGGLVRVCRFIHVAPQTCVKFSCGRSALFERDLFVILTAESEYNVQGSKEEKSFKEITVFKRFSLMHCGNYLTRKSRTRESRLELTVSSR